MQAVYIWFGGLREEGKILVRLKTTGAKTTFTSGNDAGPLQTHFKDNEGFEANWM